MNLAEVKGSQRPEQVRYITKSVKQRGDASRQLHLLNDLRGPKSNLLKYFLTFDLQWTKSLQVCVELLPAWAHASAPATAACSSGSTKTAHKTK